MQAGNCLTIKKVLDFSGMAEVPDIRERYRMDINYMLRRQFSKNLKMARMENGISEKDLAYRLNREGETDVTAALVSRWEKGSRLAPVRMIPVIAGILGVSPDWMIGVSKKKRNRKENCRNDMDMEQSGIRAEDLYLYRGEPVWVRTGDKNSKEGFWGMVSEKDDSILTADNRSIPFYRITGDVFRTPVPFIKISGSAKRPVSLQELFTHETILAECIGPYEKRLATFGWYSRSADYRHYGNGNMKFFVKDYAVKWIAYTDI